MLFKPGQDQAVALQHGTLAYMPPELLANGIVSYAADVYSFGVLLWEMFTAQASTPISYAFPLLHVQTHDVPGCHLSLSKDCQPTPNAHSLLYIARPGLWVCGGAFGKRSPSSDGDAVPSQTPYSGMSEKQIMHRKLHEQLDMPAPAGCPAELAQLMQSCLNRSCSLRPPMASVTAQLHELLATFWPDDD
jgi:serine/threonine protein kinase